MLHQHCGMDTFYEMHTICSFSPLNFDMRNGDGMKVIDKIHHALSLSLSLALHTERHSFNAVYLTALFIMVRSPLADPKSKGIICGFTLDTSEKHLALLYLATIQGIAYGTRHIVEHCNAHGHKIDTLLACGGLAKNSLYIQEHADITGKFPCTVVLQLSISIPSFLDL
jgi:ribulose kinase